MTRARSAPAGRDLATLFEAGAVGGGDDAELLRTFAGGPGTAAGEAAFRAILARHGPMVLGVCRRVVGDYHAADDAFQATFVILARKAHSVWVDGSLGGWLYGVSSRVARRARAVGRAARLRTRDVNGI